MNKIRKQKKFDSDLDDDNIFSIRADKDFVGEINKNVNVRINLNKFFLFDSTTEQRIRV